jgi:cellulose synthase/poly-beta-1,6-N-acetylglucosamine synthase-like glycosyltransferase
MHPLDLIAYLSFGGIAVWGICQIRWSLATIRKFETSRGISLPAGTKLPKAAVVICLRGRDPTLEECMQGLLAQNYPDFKIFAVVDSEQDPSAAVMKQIAGNVPAERLEIQYLTERLKTCSLKNSSQLQVLNGLDPSFEFVVFVDSDAATPDDFLMRMIAPLVLEGAEVSSGVRWFDKNAPGLASLSRYFWNMVTAGVMGYFQMPWGGAMALKREFIERADVRDALSKCICEDIPIGYQIHKHKAKLAVADIVRTCKETASFKDFIVYGNRQLLYAKLYHPAWPTVFAASVGTFAAYLVLAFAPFYYSATGNYWMTGVCLSGVALYWLCLHFAQEMLEKRIGLNEKKSRSAKLNWANAAIITQHLQAWFALSAMFRKTIEWRGITYRFKGPYDLEMLNDNPLDGDPVAEARSTPERSII